MRTRTVRAWSETEKAKLTIPATCRLQSPRASRRRARRRGDRLDIGAQSPLFRRRSHADIRLFARWTRAGHQRPTRSLARQGRAEFARSLDQAAPTRRRLSHLTPTTSRIRLRSALSLYPCRPDDADASIPSVRRQRASPISAERASRRSTAHWRAPRPCSWARRSRGRRRCRTPLESTGLAHSLIDTILERVGTSSAPAGSGTRHARTLRMVGERAVDRTLARGTPVEPNSTPTMPPKQ